jgi:hypothetical protein
MGHVYPVVASHRNFIPIIWQQNNFPFKGENSKLPMI